MTLYQLKRRKDQLGDIYTSLFPPWGKWHEPEPPKIVRRREEVGDKLNNYDRLWNVKYEEMNPEAEKNIQEGRPYEATQQHFLNYHHTGGIPENAYKQYDNMEGVSWLGGKERYPILVKKERYGDEMIEFRKKDEKLQYVKHDKDGEILRDEKGMALSLSDEEMKEKNLPMLDTSITVFNEQGQPVGWASNEFGADGVWIINEYQKRGIGTDLLHEFRKQFPAKRRMGQMTSSGINAAKAYHRKLVQEALKNKQKVPPYVMEYYKKEPWANELV